MINCPFVIPKEQVIIDGDVGRCQGFTIKNQGNKEEIETCSKVSLSMYKMVSENGTYAVFCYDWAGC